MYDLKNHKDGWKQNKTSSSHAQATQYIIGDMTA